jgi:hypothetical protein
MKTYWGVEVYLHAFFDFGTRWRWVVSFMPRPLHPQRKNPWYPLDRRLGEPQSRSGRGGEEKNSQPLLGLEPPNIQSIAQRYNSELSRLLVKFVRDSFKAAISRLYVMSLPRLCKDFTAPPSYFVRAL